MRRGVKEIRRQTLTAAARKSREQDRGLQDDSVARNETRGRPVGRACGVHQNEILTASRLPLPNISACIARVLDLLRSSYATRCSRPG